MSNRVGYWPSGQRSNQQGFVSFIRVKNSKQRPIKHILYTLSMVKHFTLLLAPNRGIQCGIVNLTVRAD